MNSLVMTAAVITSYLHKIVPEEELLEVAEPKVEKKVGEVADQDKLVDENSIECLLEFLIEFFN